MMRGTENRDATGIANERLPRAAPRSGRAYMAPRGGDKRNQAKEYMTSGVASPVSAGFRPSGADRKASTR